MQQDGVDFTHDESQEHQTLECDHYHFSLCENDSYPPLIEILDITIQTFLKSSTEGLQIKRGAQTGSVKLRVVCLYFYVFVLKYAESGKFQHWSTVTCVQG